MGPILVISKPLEVNLPYGINIKDLKKSENKQFLIKLSREHQDRLKKNGDWEMSRKDQTRIKLKQEPPNIFRLYEENIGPITPMFADALRNAEEEFSTAMVSRAIRIAAFENKRKLSYIQGVLRNMKDKDGKEYKKDSEKDFRRYGKGKYGEIIKRRDNK